MIVLDASVVIELLLRTADAPRIEERVLRSGEDLHAPHLVDIEVAQVMRRYVLRGEVTAAHAADCLDVLARFPLTRYPHWPLLDRVWALHGNLTAYDASYVALAESLDVPLLTRDRRLFSDAPGHRARIELA